jgi:hypothetical protein
MLSEDFNTAQNKIPYVISRHIKDYKPFSDLCINADHKLKIHFSGSRKLIINKSPISEILKSHLSSTNKGYSEVPNHFHFLGEFYMGFCSPGKPDKNRVAIMGRGFISKTALWISRKTQGIIAI